MQNNQTFAFTRGYVWSIRPIIRKPFCKMGKKSDLCPECQKFEKKLFAFFSKEKATKKPIVSLDRVYQNTSKALGVSYTSVHRIMNGKRPCMSNIPKERSKIVDDFEKSLCY
jgi:hypothetical protein